MRKSRYVSVLLAGAAAIALTACEQETENNTVYGDAATCAQDFDAETCASSYRAAREEHVKQAPKFASKEECEASGFAACEAAPDTTAAAPAANAENPTAPTTQQAGGGGMFMPIMMGYMMGRMMGGGGMMGQPVYTNRDGYMFSGGRNVGQVAPGTTSLSGQKVAMRTPVRGGFGSSAGRMGGGS